MHAAHLVIRLVFLVGVVAVASACSGPGHALESAKQRVTAVRPEARLSGTRARLWRDAADFRTALAEESELLSHSFVRRILSEQSRFLFRIGVLEGEEGRAVVARLCSDDPQWIAAFVVPTSDLVMVRPAFSRSVSLLSHELGHIVSWQRGYWRIGRDHASLRPDGAPDPAWIDLDAYISCWSLEEGVAEVTAMAAEARSESRRLDFEAERKRQLEQPPLHEPAVVIGPANAVIDDLHLIVPEGETWRFPARFDKRVRDLAYGTARRFVLLQEAPEASGAAALEARFAATWTDFTATSRQLLFPEETARPSAWARWCREGRVERLDPRPDGATRLGSFILFQRLSQAADFAVAGPLETARGLRDDLALRWGEEAFVWITDWHTPSAADAFVGWAQSAWPDAVTRSRGSRVMTSWGGPLDIQHPEFPTPSGDAR